MSTDLIVPLTGEAISLDAPTDALADAFHRIQKLEVELRMARAELRTELLSRMDKELARTHQAGDFYLECEAPNQTEYDPDLLDAVLDRLMAEDKVGPAAVAQALKPKTELRPMKRGIDKLLASPNLTDEDRAAVVACAHPRTRERRLTVKRADD